MIQLVNFRPFLVEENLLSLHLINVPPDIFVCFIDICLLYVVCEHWNFPLQFEDKNFLK